MNFLNNLTLRLQVAVLSTLFLFIIIVLGVLNIMDSNKSIESAKMTNDGVILPAFDALEAQNQILRVRLSMMVNYYVPEVRDQALQQEKEARAHFEKHWATYRKSLEVMSSQQEVALADKVDQLKVEYFQRVDAVLKLPYDDENYLNAMKAGAAVGAKLMQTLVDLNDFLLETSLPAQIAADQQRAENNVSLTITLLIASVVLGIIGTLIVASVMAKNINVAVDFAELVANKRLDTSVQVGNKHTEVGKLTNALANMQHSMRSVLGNISRGSQELNAAAAQLASSAEKILDSSHQQSESASSAAASVEELTVSIDQVNSQATSTRHAAEQARQESQLSSKVIRQASEQVQSIAQTMQQSVHLAEDLGARSQEINAIVNTIRDIADQTNLLALNAAIEAARAGEQGRGFAVVADEVRKLAERTASSTEEIGAVVDNIRNGIQTMVDDMKNSESQVTEGVAMAQQAKDAIDTITKSSENILSLIASIADALNEQSSASQQVAKSVEHIAQMAEENNRLVSDASQASSQLDQLANTLHRDVAQFKL